MLFWTLEGLGGVFERRPEEAARGSTGGRGLPETGRQDQGLLEVT